MPSFAYQPRLATDQSAQPQKKFAEPFIKKWEVTTSQEAMNSSRELKRTITEHTVGVHELMCQGPRNGRGRVQPFPNDFVVVVECIN